MSVGLAVFLFVLVVLVAVAVASFFRHPLTVLIVLAALPLALVLKAFGGTSYAVFALVLLGVSAAMIHTIVDTLRLLGTAKRTERRRPAALARSARRSDHRSRIAA